MTTEPSSALEAPAPAKINLGLRILRKRDDGFHDIETIMLRIGWHDTVRVEATPDTLSLDVTFPGVPDDDSNLCMRAARLLREAAHISKGAQIRLEKRIPVGAGLGGGSSDAATTLRLLSRLWSTPTPDLARLAEQVGSDVPFFLSHTAALATGRGEKLRPLDQSTAGMLSAFEVVVAVPRVRVSTADAYARVQPHHDPSLPGLIDIVRSASPGRWRKELRNDFEPTVFADFPEIADLKKRMYASGAEYASMSGSGSAVYGLFSDRKKAARATEALGGSVAAQVWCR